MKKLTLTIVIMATAFSLNAQSPWTEKAEMATVRIGHSSIALNGKIYLFGGTTNTNTANLLDVNEYDPVSDTWSSKAAMDTARAYVSTIVVNGKIWVIGGGQDYYREPMQSIHQYDPALDSWTYITKMPRARTHQSAILMNGKIYIFGGGGTNIDPIAEFDVYDTLTKTWTTAADLPTPRMNMASVVLDGKIYAIGGMLGLADGEETMTTVEMYDPVADTWTTKAEMNVPRKYISGCAFARSGRIYVFGGTPGFLAPSLSSVEEYDPETDSWTIVSEMPLKLCAHSVAWDGEKAYISGGSEAVQPSIIVYYNSFFEYGPSKDLLPYIKEVYTDKSFVRSGTDSLLISAKLRDTTGITLYATISDLDGSIIDSLLLFDDGVHMDGDAGDSLYANTWHVDSLEEKHHFLNLHATRTGVDTIIHHMNNMAGFTTIGPVIFEKYEFTSADEIPQPGDRIKLYVTLKNNGTTVSATDIEAELISIDPLAEVTERACCQNYDDIAPGAMIQSDRPYYIDISVDCPVGKELPFELEINSGGNTYWKDTFSIMVQAPDNIDDLEETIVRIYPNPATNQITIEFDQATPAQTSIVLFDLPGKVVYSEIINTSSSHTINLSSLRKGLYLINISNEQYSYTEKVIKVE